VIHSFQLTKSGVAAKLFPVFRDHNLLLARAQILHCEQKKGHLRLFINPEFPRAEA